MSVGTGTPDATNQAAVTEAKAAPALSAAAGPAGSAGEALPPAIDASAYVGEWPFRRLPYAQPAALLRKMAAAGIERAVVSRLENVFYKDVMVGNRELQVLAMEHSERFVPAYTLNPAFPGWEEDLDICLQDLGMRYLRLHPNYHRYRLLDPGPLALLRRVEQAGLVVLVALGLEDVRHHHWLTMVPNVSAVDVAEAVNAFPGIRFVLYFSLTAGGAAVAKRHAGGSFR